MSNLGQLINELCPYGAEYIELDKLAKIPTRKENTLSGGPMRIPSCGSGGIIRLADRELYCLLSVQIPQNINHEIIIPKFLYHYLSMRLIAYVHEVGGISRLPKAILSKIKVPTPPLPIQEEIVRMLDNYAEFSEDLLSDISDGFSVMYDQYIHYRKKLLTFGDDTERKPLEQICINCDRYRRPITKSTRQAGKYPYYGATGIIDCVSEYNFDGDYLLISEDGSNLISRLSPIAFSISRKNWVNNHAHVLRFNTYEMQRFVEIYLNAIDLDGYISKGTTPKLTQNNLNKIAIPDIEQIKYVIEVIDHFYQHCLDWEQKLLTEISVVEQQYEHYRNGLLTFKKKWHEHKYID